MSTLARLEGKYERLIKDQQTRIAELEEALREATAALERMEMHCTHSDVDVPRHARKLLEKS